MLFSARDGTLQKDILLVYTSIGTGEFSEGFGIDDSHQPAKYPDLNIIEIAWYSLKKSVYQGGREFEDVTSLLDAVMTTWNNLELLHIRTLHNSIPACLIFVPQNACVVTCYQFINVHASNVN